MSQGKERDWSRANAVGHIATGGALLGAAAAGNYANERALERRGLDRPFRTVMQRKRLKGAHARFMGAKAVTRAGQVVGLPLVAYGAYNAIKPDHKVPRVSVKRDVAKPIASALTFEDAKAHAYRRVTKRDLSQADSKKLLRRKRLGRDLSLAGGTLGGLALTLRSPEIARAVASRSKKLASTKPVQRLAALEPKATKTSNTLGIAAIGSGSAGSFNYASQQRLEAKQIKKSYVGGGKWVAANALSRRARASLKAQAKAKKLHGAAGGATDKDTKLSGLLHAEWNRQRGVIRELEGRGHIRSLKGNIREGGALLPEGVGGYQAPVPVKGPQRKATRLVVMDPTKMDGNERIAVHEMTHATAGRKPLSQQVRFARHPEKAAGEEARAVASEGLRGRALRRHGYNQLAAGRTSPKISGQSFGANWKSGYRRVGTKLGSYPAKDPVVRVRRATGVNLDDSTHIGALISAGAVTSYGGAVAGREYQHRQRSKRVAKGLPRWAINGSVGRVRVAGQHSKDMFYVIDNKDTRRLVHRNRLTFLKDPAKPKPPKGPEQGMLPFGKRDDKFLRAYRDRISPDAERGYNSMRRQRNKDRAWAAGQAGLAGVNAAGLVGAVRSRSKLWIPVTAATTGVSAVQAVRHGRKAMAYDRGPMEGIRRKARERARAGLYGPGRGMEPVDPSSRRVGKALVPRIPMPRALPKGLLRKPTLRRSYVARRPTGQQVSVRGGFG